MIVKLYAPSIAPDIDLKDSYGNPIHLGLAKLTLLSFFRDPNCPFCNLRIFQLTQHYTELSAKGLEVIALFSASKDEVEDFVNRRPRPFHIVADPDGHVYQAYGVQSSMTGKFKGVFRRFFAWLRGLIILGLGGSLRGMGGLNTTNLLPADFLVDAKGQIVHVYYGEDIGDHMPLAEIEAFLAKYQS